MSAGFDKRILMLRHESGEKTLLPLDTSRFTDNEMILVMDEYNNAIWLWVGAKASFIARRTALRMARGLKSSGYQYKDFNVAAGADQVIEIYSDRLGESETKSNYQKLLNTIKSAKPVDQFLGNLASSATLVEAEIPSASPMVKPSVIESEQEAVEVKEPALPPAEEPEVEEEPPKPMVPAPPPPEEPEPPPVPKPEAPAKIELPTSQLAGNVKAGVLIYSLLKHFNEIYVVLKDDRVRIEGPVESLTSFQIGDKELTVSPQLNFGGKQDEVLATYKDILRDLKRK